MTALDRRLQADFEQWQRRERDRADRDLEPRGVFIPTPTVGRGIEIFLTYDELHEHCWERMFRNKPGFGDQHRFAQAIAAAKAERERERAQ